MTPQLHAGETYSDSAGRITVMIMVTPRKPGMLCCDGVPMVPARPSPCSASSDAQPPGSTLRPGQRYRDSLGHIEVRCLRGGHGRLTFAGVVLTPENHPPELYCPRQPAFATRLRVPDAPAGQMPPPQAGLANRTEGPTDHDFGRTLRAEIKRS
jgi:hypothetical protein